MTAAPPVPIEYQLIGLTEDGNAGDLLLVLDQKQGVNRAVAEAGWFESDRPETGFNRLPGRMMHQTTAMDRPSVVPGKPI
ncbi:hypothetical protein [Xanthobacter sp. YC-JY1]|uniref:hypothetical protein n=1 Tax=Xanthobacter sp. YC-JY1 TaxID=2419844 RepID=UPI001F456018|nr:hypothetical protein [Xanthobacter sp. YC-JY1]UJX45731.1 hypothetical protein D7006_14130 [Xanthobacter sp. YC-JY1]